MNRSLERAVFVFLAMSCVTWGFMLGTSSHSLANTWEDSVVGDGTIDHRSYSADSHTKALAKGASNINLNEKRVWGEDSTNELTSEFSFTAGAYAGYQNQYEVKVKSAGYTHEYKATKISGDFNGKADFVTAKTTLDSLIIMDGNATFRARMIDGTGKHPATAKESDDVGRFILRQYLNISSPEKQPDDWLAFCNQYKVEGGPSTQN